MLIPRRHVLAASLLLLVACNGQHADEFMSSGKAFLDKRDYPAAVIQFKNAVQKDTASGEARYWLGVALHRGGDPQAAEIELRKAVNAGYDPDAAQPELLSTLADLNQFDKVIVEAAPEKLKTPQAKAYVMSALGTAMLTKGKLEDAKRLSAEAAAIDPPNAAPQILRARLALVDQKPEEALRILAEAVAKAPEDFEALRMLAHLSLARGKDKEAIALYERALAVRPTSLAVYLALIPALLRAPDLERAQAHLDAVKKAAGGSPGTRYLEALVAYSKRDRPTAREAVRQALKSGADFTAAQLLSGTIEYELGNYTVAEDLLQKVATSDPGDVQSRRLLTSIYLKSNQLKKAQGMLAALQKLEPDMVETNVLAGQVANAAQDTAKAVEYLQKAVARDPKNAITRTLLGASYIRRGDVQRGIAELESASAADPSRIEADVALIQHFLRQKQLDKAAAAADALTKKQPANPQSPYMRGSVLMAKGDLAGTRKALDEAVALQADFLPAVNSLAALDIKDKKYDDAIGRYRAILAKNPKQVEAALMLASILQRTDARMADIDKVLADAVAADPANARARLSQLIHFQQTQRKKEMLDAAQQAVAAVPTDSRLMGYLGAAQMANGEHAQAAVTFGKLAALDPRNPDPLARQATAYAADKDFTSARKTLGKAIELQPDNVLLRATLVDIGVAEQRPDAAISDARAIQAKWPKKSTGYIAEVVVLNGQRKTKEAEALLRNTLGKVEDAGVALQLFALLHKAGRNDEADRFVAEWIASKPKDAALAAAAGEESLARQDYATAIRWYRAALKARPDNPVLLNNLAWALGQAKDPQAMATAEKAKTLAPNNPAIIDTLGWLQLQAGDSNSAVTTLTRAVGLAPKAAPIRVNLAKALIAAGKKEEARMQLQAVSGLSAPQATKDEAEKLLGSL